MQAAAVIGFTAAMQPYATVLGALHLLAEVAGPALTPLFGLVSLLGEKGACFFALALALTAFKRTRRAGAVGM